MSPKLLDNIKEVVYPIAPIAILVVLFEICFAFMEPGMLPRWIIGSALAALGLFLFLHGLQQCLIPMGELLGARFIYMPNIWLLILLAFFIGALANAADPSVMVLSKSISATSGEGAPHTMVFLAIVVGGVGMLLVCAIFRIIWNLSPAVVFGFGIAIILTLSCFAPSPFVPLALDSGGVATGPLTVPFFLAIGMGFVSNLAGRSASTDGFGLLGLAAMGPIIGVLILGIVW